MRCLASTAFEPAVPPVELKADEIQVWLHLAGPGGRPGEYWLRELLSGYLERAPDAVRLMRGEHGKPFVAGELEFNLSHSRHATVVALSRTQPLGIDIEAGTRTRPVLELARRFFAAEETVALERLDPGLRQAAFLGLWSCKEAVVKALGRGLGFGLARVVIGLDTNATPTGLNVIDASAGTPDQWHIVRLAPAPAVSGALAWRGRPHSVRAFAAT